MIVDTGGLPHVCCPPEPVVLGWSGWTPWTFSSECSARCGGGSRTRVRHCRGARRQRECRGEREQEVDCNSQPCGESWVESNISHSISQSYPEGGVLGKHGPPALPPAAQPLSPG